MRKLTFFLLLVGCTGLGQHAAAAGIAYQNAFFTASNTPLFVNCRDLTDEEYETNDDPDKPTYDYAFTLPWEDEIEDGLAAQEVIEDDEGNIWNYEDDGSITVVPA